MMSVTKLADRAVPLYSMLGLGLLTLTTGVLLHLSREHEAHILILSGLDSSRLVELHVSTGLITVMVILVHLHKNRRTISYLTKTTLGKT